MNIDDFRYMWRGKQLQSPDDQQSKLLNTIHIRGKGNKRALLLLHGFSSSPAVFRLLLPALDQYDAIICPTLPGHGESIAAFTTASSKDWLAAAEHACEKLMKEYQQVDVMGLSLGGLLACHLSQRFALHHLYLLAPALKLQLNVPLALTLARALKRLGFKYLRNRAGNLYSEAYSELAYRQLPIATIIEILTLVNEYTFVPPTCPTDLFLGYFDKVVNSALVEKEFNNLPNCKVHWLSKSAHILPLDGDVAEIIACMKARLQDPAH